MKEIDKLQDTVLNNLLLNRFIDNNYYQSQQRRTEDGWVEKQLYDLKVIYRTIPGDASKCYCSMCKKALPIKSMRKALIDGQIEKISRTKFNGGIAIHDYIEYKQIGIYICPDCANLVKKAKRIDFKKKFRNIAAIIILCVIIYLLLKSMSMGDNVITIIIFIVAIFLLPIRSSNKRRFVILK